MLRNAPTILLIAGGSGGHVFPAISVIQVLRRVRPRWRVVLVMTRDPREQRAMASAPGLLRDAQVHVEVIPRVGADVIGRLVSWPRLWAVGRRLVAAWHPAAVVGFGGWVSVPLVLAAARHSIPAVIHEQNVQPGRANRLLAPLAQAVAVSFEETKRRWPQAGTKLVVTGNPIRFSNGATAKGAARQQWGVTDHQLTVLGVGGSGGAAVINEALPAACAQLPRELLAQLHVIHLTGNLRTDAVMERYRTSGVSARVLPFLDHMDSAYCAADLVVARAGGSTVAELAHFGCPAVFVPYPYARGHQRDNARCAERSGGAVVFEQNGRLVPHLTQTLHELLRSPQQLEAMALRIRHAAQPHAAERLAHLLLNTAERAPHG